jgi:hypothetical protein
VELKVKNHQHFDVVKVGDQVQSEKAADGRSREGGNPIWDNSRPS